jgi:hypothetical protein
MSRRWIKSNLPPPFLKRLSFLDERVKADEVPLNVPAPRRKTLEASEVRVSDDWTPAAAEAAYCRET